MTSTITYIVEGCGIFPHDMLRYDGSEFATEQDKATAGVGYIREKRRVLLRVKLDGPGRLPFTARWDSFGWAVVLVSNKPTEPTPYGWHCELVHVKSGEVVRDVFQRAGPMDGLKTVPQFAWRSTALYTK